MSYQVLYRAWRPTTFSEIYGQDPITRTLRRQVMSGHIAHAYLFCGTRGTGKTSAAKVLAKAINCLNPQDGNPCGECEICVALQKENCMDVVEIDAASNNGVDEIRDLREKIKYPPAVTKYKVYIIDEVHMLSSGAFNALLKTLEEPPRHAVFILATTEPQKLPATILSRCQRFDFKRISVETIVDRMMEVLGGIGREAEEDALYEIARAAEGAMRDALSLLDCCLSYTDGVVTHRLALEVLGTAGRGFMFDFTDALIANDAAAALRHIDTMMKNGCDPQVFARDAAAHLRAVLLADAVGDVTELLEITPEDAQRFSEQAKKSHPDQLTRMMELFMRAEPDMKWVSRPRTMLELTAVRACRPENEPDATLAERLHRIEQSLASGAALRPAAGQSASGLSAPNPPAAKAPAAPRAPKPAQPAVAATPPKPYLDAVERLGAENASIKNTLPSMRFVSYDGQVVTTEFGKKQLMHMRMLERKRELLEQVFSETFGQPTTLNMRLEGESAPAKSTSKVAKEVIDQSYDIFGRENIELLD